jgi:hypothetical protein
MAPTRLSHTCTTADPCTNAPPRWRRPRGEATRLTTTFRLVDGCSLQTICTSAKRTKPGTMACVAHAIAHAHA